MAVVGEKTQIFATSQQFSQITTQSPNLYLYRNDPGRSGDWNTFFSLSLSRSPGADRSSFILLTSINNKKENEIVCVPECLCRL